MDELKAGHKGLAGHVDVTNAFHQTTHTDPGDHFPWNRYLDMVQGELDEDENMDQKRFTELFNAALDDPNIRRKLALYPWQ